MAQAVSIRALAGGARKLRLRVVAVRSMRGEQPRAFRNAVKPTRERGDVMEPEAGAQGVFRMRSRFSKGFTLVEILIVVVILGILAAIVIPQFTNASQDAQRGNIQTQLQSIRNQIELFRVKNNGNSPTMVGATAVTAFAQLVTPPGTQQPYMRSPAINPRNGSYAVAADSSANNAATSTAAAAMDPSTAGAAGWIYNAATGAFSAVGFNESTNKWFGEP
jgi:general secretion pathway protein G